MKLTHLILVLSHVPIVVTALYALLVFRSLGRELRMFSYFLFAACIIQITALALALSRYNNLPLVHLYVLISFFCFARFYMVVLDGFVNKKILVILTIAFLLFSVVNSLFFQSIYSFNSSALTVESILVIILSLSTYSLFLNDIVKEKRENLIISLNWINSGLFVYYASSLLIFYFGDFFTRKFPASLNHYTWVLHSFFSMLMYTCFFVGLWKRPKN